MTVRKKNLDGVNPLITLKNYTCAFLEHEGNFLLMKRASDRDENPDLWSGVGGKMEPDEINDPFSACMREINEETGMTANHIENLVLRYIIIRRYKDVIRQSYIYFGKTNTSKFVDTHEGTLHWISKDELGEKKYTSTYVKMMQHYLSAMSDCNHIFVGTAENVDGNLKMSWAKIEDFID